MTFRPRSISRGVLAAVLACLAGPVASAAAQATIVSGPSGPTNDGTPTFEFTPQTAECRLPPAQPDPFPCSSPFTVGEAEYTLPLPDGDYVFEVTAGSTASRAFTIDTTAPQTQITGGPGDTTDTTAVFSFSASEAAGFSCRLDGGAWGPCDSPKTYSGLALGRHRFEVTAVDAAGNQDSTPAEHAWQVLRTFHSLTAGTVEVRARARVKSGPRRRWVTVLRGEREVPDAGRHPVRATVTKKGRRLARRRKSLPMDLRLSFTDLARRSLWATAKFKLRR